MSAYTKGPWEIAAYRNYFGFSVWSAHGPCIAERWYQHERTPQQDEEMMANARLIAAAPELLEALKNVIDESAKTANMLYSAQLQLGSQEMQEKARTAIDELTSTASSARAAIAKAEGK